jgi:phosphatidylserine decarboxylase
MTVKAALGRLLERERINFLLTNRIPRRSLTRLIGWFSQVRNPLVRDLSIAVWRFVAEDLNLHEAKKTRFESLHDCFIRELKDGARPIDPDPAVLVSPCDGIVGAAGRTRGTQAFQAKGFSYELADLLQDQELVRAYRDGLYVTLRLKSSMYHRFHAPHDLRVEQVTYIPGDAFNVNPIALRRVEGLYGRNERAVIRTRLLSTGHGVTLVPVAAVLVASIRLHFVDVLLHLGYRGPNVIPCDASLRKGQEMGFFQHGSTMIVFAPDGLELCDNVREGGLVRTGEPLLRLPAAGR